jgi:hypothetical protein
MKLLNPWFMVLILGFCVFLVGKYFQHQEKKKKNQLPQVMIKTLWIPHHASATAMLRPTSQSAQSAPGLYGLKEPGLQEQSLQEQSKGRPN